MSGYEKQGAVPGHDFDFFRFPGSAASEVSADLAGFVP
jgi:hypothetical protein